MSPYNVCEMVPMSSYDMIQYSEILHKALWLPAWWALVASLMSLMASLVTTSRMQQCFKALVDIYHEFLLLFYCCVLLEIKLTATTVMKEVEQKLNFQLTK